MTLTSVSLRNAMAQKENQPGNVSGLGPDVIEADFWHKWFHELHVEGVVGEGRRAATR